jgi:hypothetical protein
VPKLDDLFEEHGAENVWFQQDGAKAHTHLAPFARNSQINVSWACCFLAWPPRSPCLTPCDFFLWGYLKAQVYQHRPQTLEVLKEAIAQEVTGEAQSMYRQ